MLLDKTRNLPTTGPVAQTAEIERALRARRDELAAEYAEVLANNEVLRRDMLADAAGDDEVDNGTKTAEREREEEVLRTILQRRDQADRALARLAEGGYGYCETCARPIPTERLAIFPAATSCVACKQLGERRSG